jgi:hypothetical protein
MQVRCFWLLLLLMLPTAFAVEPIDLTFAVFPIAIIVGIFLALVWMLSTAIADPRLGALAKTEAREFVAALILIALITGFFIGSSGISIALTGETDYVTVSQDMIDGWIDRYDDAFTNVVGAASRVRAAASYSPYVNIPIWYVSLSYSVSPIAGIAIFLGSLNMASQALTNAIFLLEAVRLLLSFLDITIPKIFLPLAFMLRLIPFTRKLGNTLIAVAIAGIVFLPFSVILANAMNDAIDVQPSINLDVLDAKPWLMMLMEPACETIPIRGLLALTDVIFALIVCLPLLFNPFTAGAYPACYELVKQAVYPIIMNVFQLVNAAVLLAWLSYFSAFGAKEYANNIFDALQPFLRDVGNLVLLGYMDIILIGLITIVGARSLSAALGGEWYMAGIQRLI